MTDDPRPLYERCSDTEHRFETDVDIWVASASTSGAPYLVPLSFEWNGQTILVATPAGSQTARNLASTRTARLGLGVTRDVTMIEGSVEMLGMDEVAVERADRFAARTGFDPRELADPYKWFLVTPLRIQAWREANELRGRELMRDGRWL